MKEVKVMKRYKCDFCKRRSTKSIMELHERRCFRNPNRFCDYCDNKGYTLESENNIEFKQDCPYCSQRDLQKEKEIEEREKKERESRNQVIVGNEIVDLPF